MEVVNGEFGDKGMTIKEAIDHPDLTGEEEDFLLLVWTEEGLAVTSGMDLPGATHIRDCARHLLVESFVNGQG